MSTVKESREVAINPVNRYRMRFTIKSTSPLIMHKWSEKAKRQMREKHQGRKTKERSVRDPKEEAYEALYRTADGQIAIPGMGLKKAMLTAAHKDLGMARTLVSKALFLETDDPEFMLPITCADEPRIREDEVRVGNKSADFRYRPQFDEWKCEVCFVIDADLLTEQDVLNLANRAGFGVGLCDWRPEKSGEFGRFEVDMDLPVTCEELPQ